jgi:hypothetical protein
LDSNDSNKQYPKELKKQFKNVFKRLIDLYQKGIELYGQLASQQASSSSVPAANSHNSHNSEEKPLINNNFINNSNSKNSASLNANTSSINKYADMHRLLQEKFNEVENNFRNLLLIDGVGGHLDFLESDNYSAFTFF